MYGLSLPHIKIDAQRATFSDGLAGGHLRLDPNLPISFQFHTYSSPTGPSTGATINGTQPININQNGRAANGQLYPGHPTSNSAPALGAYFASNNVGLPGTTAGRSHAHTHSHTGARVRARTRPTAMHNINVTKVIFTQHRSCNNNQHKTHTHTCTHMHTHLASHIAPCSCTHAALFSGGLVEPPSPPRCEGSGELVLW